MHNSERDLILGIFKEHLTVVVKAICDDYGLEFEEVRSKYIENPLQNIETPKNQTKSSKKKDGPSTSGDGKSSGSSTVSKPRRASSKKNKNDLIETTEFVYQGTTYLVDKKKNVYTYDTENPKLVGLKLVDDSIKFYESVGDTVV